MQRRTELQWRELFLEYEDSEITAVAFCEARGLRSTYFRKKYRLFQEKTKRQSSSSSSFVPVSVSDNDGFCMLELHLGGTLKCRIPTSVSPCWLAEFVQHLRG